MGQPGTKRADPKAGVQSARGAVWMGHERAGSGPLGDCRAGSGRRGSEGPWRRGGHDTTKLAPNAMFEHEIVQNSNLDCLKGQNSSKNGSNFPTNRYSNQSFSFTYADELDRLPLPIYSNERGDFSPDPCASALHRRLVGFLALRRPLRRREGGGSPDPGMAVD